MSGPAPAAWALRFCSTEGQRRASHCSPSGPALPSLARDVVSLRAGAARARVASPAPAAADERRQAGRGHPQRGRERDPVHAARGLHQLLCAKPPTLDPTFASPATSERRTSHAYVTGARSPAQHVRAELASGAALESCDRPGGSCAAPPPAHAPLSTACVTRLRSPQPLCRQSAHNRRAAGRGSPAVRKGCSSLPRG